jgi:DNA topoisomerase VI subunit B
MSDISPDGKRGEPLALDADRGEGGGSLPRPTFQQAESPPTDPSAFTKLESKKQIDCWTPERRQRLAEMWQRRDSVPAIAEALGTTVGSVYMARHYYRLPPRKGSTGRPRGIANVKRDPSKPKITRVAFETSRLMEFCTERELTNQTGHDSSIWPLVVLKELVDNALDAAEEAEIAPAIDVRVDSHKGLIVIADNGPGIPASTIAGILDYTVRVSSNEAYVSPTRGQQGNALKTLLAMGFVLDGNRGETLIEARGVAHRIVFRVDQIRLEPDIVDEKAVSPVRKGTRITVHWPGVAALNDQDLYTAFLRLASDYAWLNPHLTLRVWWNNRQRLDHTAFDPNWTKWRPSDPTCPHWYDLQRFERYMAAHIAQRQKRGREQFTVRKFISEFRGLTSTAKQKAILEELGLRNMPLAELFGSSEHVNHELIAKLHDAMKRRTKKVPARQIGVIGRDHLFAMFKAAGGHPETFKYLRKFNEIDGVPRVIEIVFGVTTAGFAEDRHTRLRFLENGEAKRRLITAVNWSAALGNPFRSLGRYGQGLDGLLSQLHAGASEPIIALVHLACPRVSYLDRGKSSVVVE